MFKNLFVLIWGTTLAVAAFAQQPNPTPAPPPSVTPQANQIQSSSVYPGPVVTAVAGSTVVVQFEVQTGDGKLTRNLLNLPLSIRVFGAPDQLPSALCQPTIGQCVVSSKGAGPITIGLYSPGGEFGYTQSQLIINFLPGENQARIGPAPLVVSASSVQSGERETVSLFATVPEDIPGHFCQAGSFLGSGDPGQYLAFPDCFKRGQRILVGKFDVLALQGEGTYYLTVNLFGSNGERLASGVGSYAAKSGFRQLDVQMDRQSNLTVSTNIYGPNADLTVVLLRGDGFYLPLTTVPYSSGTQTDLVFYNQSLGYPVDLPFGYYTVAIVGRYLDGSGSFTQVLPNGLYLDRQTRLD